MGVQVTGFGSLVTICGSLGQIGQSHDKPLFRYLFMGRPIGCHSWGMLSPSERQVIRRDGKDLKGTKAIARSLQVAVYGALHKLPFVGRSPLKQGRAADASRPGKSQAATVAVGCSV